MSDQNTDPTTDPLPEPPVNPWARLEAEGIDPNDPHLLDRIRWGSDIMDSGRRAQAIEYLMDQDPQIRAAMEAKFGSVEPVVEPHNPWAPPADDTGGYDDPQGPLDPAQVAEWVKQEASRTATEQMEAFRAEQQEQRLGDIVTQQVQALGSVEGLSQVQQEEVFNRAWQNIQSGRVTQEGFPQAAVAALTEIRGVWAPPAPPADPLVEAGQRYAGQPRAPIVAAGTGPQPSGDQPINSVNDAAAAARRIIQENQGGWS